MSDIKIGQEYFLCKTTHIDSSLYYLQINRKVIILDILEDESIVVEILEDKVKNTYTLVNRKDLLTIGKLTGAIYD